jgi:hypothetical protein
VQVGSEGSDVSKTPICIKLLGVVLAGTNQSVCVLSGVEMAKKWVFCLKPYFVGLGRDFLSFCRFSGLLGCLF